MGVASGTNAAGVWNSCKSDMLLSAGERSWLLTAGEALAKSSPVPGVNVICFCFEENFEDR